MFLQNQFRKMYQMNEKNLKQKMILFLIFDSKYFSSMIKTNNMNGLVMIKDIGFQTGNHIS